MSEMSETNEVSHPSLKQFKSALDQRKVGRALMETFDRWRNNPEKCAPGSDLKAACDALWERFQTEMGGSRRHRAPPGRTRPRSRPRTAAARDAVGRAAGTAAVARDAAAGSNLRRSWLFGSRSRPV